MYTVSKKTLDFLRCLDYPSKSAFQNERFKPESLPARLRPPSRRCSFSGARRARVGRSKRALWPSSASRASDFGQSEPDLLSEVRAPFLRAVFPNDARFFREFLSGATGEFLRREECGALGAFLGRFWTMKSRIYCCEV